MHMHSIQDRLGTCLILLQLSDKLAEIGILFFKLINNSLMNDKQGLIMLA